MTTKSRIVLACLAVTVAIAMFSVAVAGRSLPPAVERGQFVELFGPVQNEGSLFTTPGSSWGFGGAATSTSCKTFWFNRAWATLTWVDWRVEWIPTNTSVSLRLIDADDGITNIHQIATIAGQNNTNPLASAVDVTSAMQTLATAGVYKHICWQVQGNGSTQIRIYQSHLEILES